jgi:hypothetical protein
MKEFVLAPAISTGGGAGVAYCQWHPRYSHTLSCCSKDVAIGIITRLTFVKLFRAAGAEFIVCPVHGSRGVAGYVHLPLGDGRKLIFPTEIKVGLNSHDNKGSDAFYVPSTVKVDGDGFAVTYASGESTRALLRICTAAPFAPVSVASTRWAILSLLAAGAPVRVDRVSGRVYVDQLMMGQPPAVKSIERAQRAAAPSKDEATPAPYVDWRAENAGTVLRRLIETAAVYALGVAGADVSSNLAPLAVAPSAAADETPALKRARIAASEAGEHALAAVNELLGELAAACGSLACRPPPGHDLQLADVRFEGEAVLKPEKFSVTQTVSGLNLRFYVARSVRGVDGSTFSFMGENNQPVRLRLLTSIRSSAGYNIFALNFDGAGNSVDVTIDDIDKRLRTEESECAADHESKATPLIRQAALAALAAGANINPDTKKKLKWFGISDAAAGDEEA